MQRSQETKHPDSRGRLGLAACELQLLSLPGCQRTIPGCVKAEAQGPCLTPSSGQERQHSQVRPLAAGKLNVSLVPATFN